MQRTRAAATLLLASLILALASQARAQSSFEVAARHYQDRQWQAAAEAFLQIADDSLQHEATRLSARLYAGESFIQLGDYTRAKTEFELLGQTAPAGSIRSQASFRLGEVAFLAGEFETARELLGDYLNSNPTDSFVSFAQDYLLRLETRVSDSADFKKLEEAVGWQRDARHDIALAGYHQLLKHKGLNLQLRAEVLRRAAQLHQQLDHLSEALPLYQLLLAEFPHSPHAAQVQSSVAWIYDQLDQPTQAAEQFRQLYEKFPHSPQAGAAAYWLAMWSADQQNSAQAMHYIDWLLEQQLSADEANDLRGKSLCLKCQLLASQENWPAIEELAELHARQLPPGTSATRLEFWQAESVFRQRHFEEALTLYEQLQPKTIGISEAWTAMVPLRVAQLTARRQQWTKVLRQLDRLEADHPDFQLDYEVDYLRGRALAGRGEMSAARNHYQRVLDNPKATDTEAATMAGWMIGETYFHQNEYALARRAYLQVIELTEFPQWQARAALQAGKCWELEENWDEAVEVYSRALERWPHSAAEQELQSRLRWAEIQTTQIK